MPAVSILIKALNEERHVADCLAAAVREARSVDGEVILVDSLSTDNTVAIARQFPVRIVQFDHLADRGCGAAVQLGFQYAQGDFVYVLDADMVLQPGFLCAALARLRADAALGGVGGKVLDTAVRTASDKRRAAAALALTADRQVAELGGGGLYRAAAVRALGYLAHRGLAAYEEAELGARLHTAGWGLLRLAQVAVVHKGHAENNWQMMRRLWRNGRAGAGGAVLRAALGKPWFGCLMRKQGFLLAAPALHVLAGAAAGGVTLGGGGRAGVLAAVATVWLVALLLLSARKRGLRAGGWTLLLWHYFALAAVLGFLRPAGDPLALISGHELPHGAAARAPMEAEAC